MVWHWRGWSTAHLIASGLGSLHVVEPLLGGVYAGHARRISAAAAVSVLALGAVVARWSTEASLAHAVSSGAGDTVAKAEPDGHTLLLVSSGTAVSAALFQSLPFDTLKAFTEETNGANLQADASVYELATRHSIPVQLHLSGAVANKLTAATATCAFRPLT